MAFFEARVQDIKFSYSPFTTLEMMDIGQIVLDHIVARIQHVTDVTDSPARSLKETYAEEKRKGRRVALSTGTFRGLPVRDWTLRGRTLSACKVKFASQERVTIGPTSEETGKIMTARNRLDNMWGISPSDHEVMIAAIMATFRRTPPVRVELMGTRGKAA